METYDVVAVSFTPGSTTPTRAELGAIRAEGLGWGTELNRDGFIEVAAKVETIPENIRSRLRDLYASPLELRLYRGSNVVQAGPVIGWNIAGADPTISIHARGFLYYLRYMLLTTTLTYSAVDQYTIGKGLVDHWQAKSYGNFGIDTTGIGTSGTTRDRTYDFLGNHIVYDRLIELAQVDGGFDLEIDPETLDLAFSASIGTDRSSTVILDRRNISDPGLVASVAAGDAATYYQTVSTSAALGSQATNAAGDEADFGLRAAAQTADGVVVQATLDSKNDALEAALSSMFLRPAARAVPLQDMDVESFDVGDVIGFDFDPGIGRISMNRRVARKTVSVSRDGVEDMTVEFV